MNEGPGMLSGLSGPLGASMFEHLTPRLEPTAEDMERQRQAALFNKLVKVKCLNVQTFDLSIKKQAKEYAQLLMDVFSGLQTKTHVILFNERKFVEQPKPRWIAHIEWMEFKLDVKANPTTGKAKEK